MTSLRALALPVFTLLLALAMLPFSPVHADAQVRTKVARFSHRVDLNPGGKPNTVRFFDKLTLKPDGTLRNTALVTKFAFPVARVKVNFARSLKGARAIKP